jgi:hypothetical protein
MDISLNGLLKSLVNELLSTNFIRLFFTRIGLPVAHLPIVRNFLADPALMLVLSKTNPRQHSPESSLLTEIHINKDFVARYQTKSEGEQQGPSLSHFSPVSQDPVFWFASCAIIIDALGHSIVRVLQEHFPGKFSLTDPGATLQKVCFGCEIRVGVRRQHDVTSVHVFEDGLIHPALCNEALEKRVGGGILGNIHYDEWIPGSAFELESMEKIYERFLCSVRSLNGTRVSVFDKFIESDLQTLRLPVIAVRMCG